MHTVGSEMGSSVPAFLGKLWRLVEDPETDDLICWAPNGRSFFIRNQAQFARELLPHYYKHNNMASFVRQLNMYGFHKKVSVELGGLKCDRDEMEFAHQYFCKDHPYLLDHIKRKIATNKTQDPSQAPIKPELMNRMLTEVRSMRGRQEHFDSRLGAMKRENEALWRELALLRQKHHKQQQIVNKLIHFLVSLVQPNRNAGLAMKRRYPLMIDDVNRQRMKQSKHSKAQHSPSGPAIHELDGSDAELDSEYIVAEMLDNDHPPTVESPEHLSEDGMREYYLDESVKLPQEIESCQTINGSRKRLKGKKKEETVLLEVPVDQVQTIPQQNSPVISVPSANLPPDTTITKKPPKTVPAATMRSSKLAAMAANMKRNIEVDMSLGINDFNQAPNQNQELHTPVKLENIMVVPDVTNEGYSPLGEDSTSNIASSVSSLSTNGGSPTASSSPENNLDNGGFGNIDFLDSNSMQQPHQQQQLPKDKNMSLSCVNSSGMTEANYREEVDTHLDSMQSELENLREILRGEGYSIDANTLLGLFGAEDPMSFGIPINPDLDPHANNPVKDHDDDTRTAGICFPFSDQYPNVNSKEVMAYNGPNLLDFDDDMFFNAGGATSASPVQPVVTDVTNNLHTSDSLDSKSNLFDSLISANNGVETHQT